MRINRSGAFALALLLSTAGLTLAACNKPPAAASGQPWTNTKLSADKRADLLVAAMTQDEKIVIVSGYFAQPADWQHNYLPPPEAHVHSAGYVPGIPRLGIPAQFETDAGTGVATQRTTDQPRERTALPAGIATAATWNTKVAQAGGAMIGDEARRSGFNVMLAGGIDLSREARNGRNFEYGGEDPLLAGRIVGSEIKGIQSNKIVSTIKHFAFNDQETDRNTISVKLADDQARMSDLLAFQIGIEVGDPASVMCAYNRVDSVYACESDYLLNQVLKQDWGYKGYVMSDWGADHSTVDAANNGLDQQSAASFDEQPYFRDLLKQAIADGKVPQARLDDMVRRILRSMIVTGAFDNPVTEQPGTIDFAAHAKVTQADAEEAAVLLKNDGNLLPLMKTAKSIVIVGGHADVGVLSGGGSSQVYPRGGAGFSTGPNAFPGPELYFPSSPMKAIQARAPGATVTYVDGSNPAAAAKAAAGADIALVFATQWSAESLDTPFKLRDRQDALISAVAGANKKTVVVLETSTGTPMPWLANAGAVLEAWYPGTEGGEAIARLLFGEVNPSGRLPVTFAKSEDQLPEPKIVSGKEVTYKEGAAAGYKWFDKNNLEPLFPFGFGLSYTSFDYGDLKATGGQAVKATFTLHNSGQAGGKTVAQIYVSPKAGGWEAPKRLGGFEKVDIAPGASATVSVDIDPRLLAVYDSASKSWKIAAGDYDVMLAASSRDIKATTTVKLDERTLPAGWHP